MNTIQKVIATAMAMGIIVACSFAPAQDQCNFKGNQVTIVVKNTSSSIVTSYTTNAKEVFNEYDFTRYYITDEEINYIDLIEEDKFVIVYNNGVEEYHGI